MRDSFRPFILLAALAALVSGLPGGAESPAIATMDTLRFNPPEEKGKAELIEGKVAGAVRFTWEKDARSTFFTSNLRGAPEWDRAEGFSFWVKGEGGEQYGGLQFIYDEDYAVRYDYVFPVRGTEWTKVTVAWRDLLPVLPGPKAKPLDPRSGNPPSKLSAFWLGRWWYWGDYPPLSFAIDEIRLEERVPRDTADYRPSGPPLARVLEKLKGRRPLTLVTMGDSLTDFRRWANRKVAWPNLLRDRLQEKYGSQVTVRNPAIGGTQLLQNLVLIPRWLGQAPEADLVTVCFGANDWEAGMRGGAFREANVEAVDRLRRATGGKADVLLLTTVPGVRRWETMAELAGAVRLASRDRNGGLADIERAFLEAGRERKERLFVEDGTHLSPEGHDLVARTVLEAIERAGR